MKKFFNKDVLFSTLFIFLVMYLLRLFVFNIEFLNPIGNALKDFHFTDIYYSRLIGKDPARIDTNIILVNIGYDTREEIADKIRIIRSFDPAVIGLDMTFEEPREAKSDSVLATQITGSKDIVLATYFEYKDDDEVIDRQVTSASIFRENNREGFINFPSAELEGTIRHFTPELTYRGEQQRCFAAEIVRGYDPAAFDRLISRRPKAETIDYKGNVESFIIFDAGEIHPLSKKLEVLRGRIVLLGFLGPDLETKVLEDIHFTPLNKKYSGRSFPDMYGVVIHANIIHTILQGDYFFNIPLWVSLIFSLLLTYMYMYFFIRIKMKWVIWYQVIVRSIQLLATILVVAMDIMVFRRYGFKMDAAIIVIPILLSIDSLEIYEGIVKWMNKRFGYKTMFAGNE